MERNLETVSEQSTAPLLPLAKRKRSPKLGTYSLFLVLLLYFVAIAYPLFWMVMNSLKESSEIFSDSWALPTQWLFENYVTAWEQGISDYFLNSVIVTSLTCFLTVLLSALGAYGLTRFQFRGKSLILILILGGLMLSPQVSLIPLYKLIQSLGLFNTYWALIIPYVAYRLPFTILLIRAHFLTIPKEIEEAAYLDGCSSFGVFTRIFLPLSTPILLTSTLLTAYFSWNEFLFSIIFIDDNKLKTIPSGLMAFRDMLQTDWGVLLAGLTISALPIILLFLFMQKYFVRGLTSGGIKG
ncbi:carbohydrate ABC transporter permease [Brevibacillus centrosporus]|uniref:carbohydrate ABC transporter permease n=1 Tax=Brevibacillus centrosporus TaxID=54910 RepID=UPI002E23B25F|nr:carbohydrate ABC transporter permease [Brevibacillus centrosporus]